MKRPSWYARRWPRTAATAGLVLAMTGAGAVTAVDEGASALAPQSSTTSPIRSTRAPLVRPVYVAVASTTRRTDDDHWAPTLTDENIRTWFDDLDDFIAQQSEGLERLRLAGIERVSLGDSECRPRTLTGATMRQVFGGWESVPRGPARLAIFSLERTCLDHPGGGAGSSVISSQWGLDSFYGRYVLAHEYLHSLGLGHANVGYCNSDGPADRGGPAFLVEGCQEDSYGNMLDVMGGPMEYSRPHLSAFDRIDQGWMPTEAWADLSPRDPAAVHLRPLDESVGIRAARIVDPWTGVPYVFDYRVPRGADDTWAAWSYETAPGSGRVLKGERALGMLRVLRPSVIGCSRCGTTAIAVGSPRSRVRREWLMPGETFEGSGAFMVTVRSVSIDDGVRMDVTWSPRTSTTMSVRTWRTERSWFDDLRIGVNVKTAEGVTVGGQPVDVYAGNLHLGRTTAGRALRLPDLRELGGGTHRLRAVAADTALLRGTRATGPTITVQRSGTRLRAPLGVRRAGESVSVPVTLVSDFRHGAPLEGALTATARGKVLGRWRVEGENRSRMVVRVPIRRLRGVDRLHVRYGGSPLLRPSRALVRVR